MRPRLFNLTIALAALCVVAAPDFARAQGELHRWQLEPDEGLVYELRGDGAAEVADGAHAARTLYGSEIADGWRYTEPVGRARDLILHYAFRLPEAPARDRARLEVDDRHLDLPDHHGHIRAAGSCAVRRRGPASQIAWSLELTPLDADDRTQFGGGTLHVTSTFHQRQALVLQAEFRLAYRWQDEDRVLEGSLALRDRLDLTAPALQRRVDAAVRRGLDRVLKPYLAQYAHRDRGSQRLGHLGVVLYAALHAGLPRNDALVRQALEEIEALPWEETYSVALAILALEARAMQRVPDRGAGSASRPRIQRIGLDRRDRALLERLTRWLIDARNKGRGTWTYRPPDTYEDAGQRIRADHSNTQFAILALHAAAREGIDVPTEIWEEIADHFIRQQLDGPPHQPALELEPDSRLRRDATATARPGERRARGFGYGATGSSRAYSSMSAAGTSSLMIALRWLADAPGADRERLEAVRQAILDGLAWHDRHHTVRRNWPDRGWPIYHLYSLEKLYQVTGVRRIGGHDWWAQGANELLLREDAGGGWDESHSETALAILFLMRATAEPELELRELARPRTGGGAADLDEDEVYVPGAGVVRLGELARACDTPDAGARRERLELLARAAEAIEEERRLALVPPLSELLDARAADVRRAARRHLREALELTPRDADEALAHHARWLAVRALDAERGPEAIAGLRAHLREAQSPPVRRAAALALARLDAAEAIPDLIEALDAPDAAHRRTIHQVLVALAGRDPGYDPAGSAAERARGVERWRALWERQRADRIGAGEER